ncbi:uncharacterized protein LOC128288931 [Gossypium arboreum]|uniref:uncharacterized protein LOC128288931 n=1 Tax=Gossypium arboreum TaxID=29729 RepID=UPI0022F197E8|nr:uncharacterized protein LOC128288931 [Gossypium arboreum]
MGQRSWGLSLQKGGARGDSFIVGVWDMQRYPNPTFGAIHSLLGTEHVAVSNSTFGIGEGLVRRLCIRDGSWDHQPGMDRRTPGRVWICEARTLFQPSAPWSKAPRCDVADDPHCGMAYVADVAGLRTAEMGQDVQRTRVDRKEMGRDESRRQRLNLVGSWRQGHSAATIPVAYLSRRKGFYPPLGGNYAQEAPATCPPRSHLRHVPLGPKASFALYPSQTNDLHVGIAAGLHEFPLASPRSGIVHHLSGPDRHALTRTLLRRSRSVGGAPVRDPANQLPCALRVFQPVDSHTCQTPWSVFQDGPNGEPAGRRPEHAGAEARRDGACWIPRSRRRRLHRRIKGPGLGRRHDPRRSTPRADRRTGSRRSTSDRGASPAPIRFPPDNFKHSLTLFSKSFSSFPRGTCSLSVSHPYLALDGIYRPIRAAFPNNPTRRQRLVVRQGPGTTGLSPSPAPLSRGLGPGPPLRTLLQTTIRTPVAPDSQAGLFPVRSPLLGESW